MAWPISLDTRRSEQLGGVVDVGQVGKTAVQLELELALATTHATPAVEQNAGNDNDADDDQPLAQTDIH